MNKALRLLFVPIIATILSIVLGIVFDDNFLGIVTLAVGFLNAYYMAIGKWYNYIFGFLFSLSYALVCLINGLFGWVIFTIIFYLPSQVLGMINWFKNKQDDIVKMRSFNVKTAILVCVSMVFASAVFGYLLSLIPFQQLSFLDGTTQIVNVCGIVLSLYRYREAWYLWLFNNILDLSIWIVNVIKTSSYSEMMLITSIMYLIMNIIGIVFWIKTEKSQINARYKQICEN